MLNCHKSNCSENLPLNISTTHIAFASFIGTAIEFLTCHQYLA